MYVKAALCHCRCRLEAENKEDLLVVVRQHVEAEHANQKSGEDTVSDIISNRAYDIEYMTVPVTEAWDLADDFGPEPY